MDISALNQDDYKVWVPFGDAEVLIRFVSMDELRRIIRRATKTSLRPHKEEIDPIEANRLLGRAAVRGWKGITMNGEEFPYTPENCDLLMERWMEFSRFVNEVCTDLRALVAAEQEQAEKNSSLTSGQDSTGRV